MPSDFQSIIIYAIVALTTILLVRTRRKAKSRADKACGCDGCDASIRASKKRPLRK